MNRYKLYFEFYGHKFTTEVTASTEQEAKEKVKDSIRFHKVVQKPNEDLDAFNQIMNIFGFNK